MSGALFNRFDLSGLELPNRVVMAPMTRARAVHEVPDDLTVRYYAQRSSAGLIVAEGAPVSREGLGGLFIPGLHTDEQEAGWRRVTDAVRQRGGRIVAQLWHVGRVSHVSLQLQGHAPVSSTATASGDVAFAYGPDGIPGPVPASAPRALGTEEVARVVSDFVAAAARADRAGFHGVELHGATAYLFEQFLNSEVNDRADRYGAATLADRLRFTLEVVDAVVAELGADRVGLRVSPYSTVGRMPVDPKTEETHLALSREIADRGLAYLHVHDTAAFSDDPIAHAARVRTLLHRMRPELGSTALMLAGGLTRDTATEMLDGDLIDLAAFGQPYIANPDLVERLRLDLPLAHADRATYFGGDATGYIDYPALEPTSLVL